MKSGEFLVIGAGRFGQALATTLYDLGHSVVVVDRNGALIENIMDRVTHALIADATEEETLRELGVEAFDRVIVAIGTDFEANVLATVNAKACGAKYVISKATSAVMATVLSRVGADEVIRPEHDMGIRLANHLTTPSIVDAFNLGDDYNVVEVEAGEKLNGPLSESRLPNRFGVQVIAVNRDGDLTISPRADFEVQRGDRIVVIGSVEAVNELRDYLSKDSSEA